MKASLVSVPFVRDYMRNARCDFVSLSNTQWYPILLGWAGAYLEGRGHGVQLIDGQAEEVSVEEVLDRVKAFRPDLVVVYGGLKSREADRAFGERAHRETGARVAFVGPYVSIDPASWVRPEWPDLVAVAGEFDGAIEDLLKGADPATTLNVWTCGPDGRPRGNPPRPYLDGKALDAIPFVTEFLHRHLDVRHYKAPSEPHPFLDIMTGRGCAWGRCTYCLWPSTWVRGPRYAARSVESVVEEFRFVERSIPRVRSLMIQDDTITPERAREISEGLIRAGTRLRWSCYMRADCPEEVLRLMRRAGCLNLHVGYETSNPETLRSMKKGLNVDRMERFTRAARKAGLRIHGDFLIGFPGETEESTLRTIEWSCRLRPHTAQYQVFLPYPGTPVHRMLVEKGWLDSQGRPDTPMLPARRLDALSRKGYRSFYLSLPWLLECLLHPHERVLKRIDTYLAAIPAVFRRDEE